MTHGGIGALQGLAGITTNPVLSDGIAGLATSATAQATVQVCLCVIAAHCYWPHDHPCAQSHVSHAYACCMEHAQV